MTSSERYGFLWNRHGVGPVDLGRNDTRWVADSAQEIDYYVVIDRSPSPTPQSASYHARPWPALGPRSDRQADARGTATRSHSVVDEQAKASGTRSGRIDGGHAAAEARSLPESGAVGGYLAALRITRSCRRKKLAREGAILYNANMRRYKLSRGYELG